VGVALIAVVRVQAVEEEQFEHEQRVGRNAQYFRKLSQEVRGALRCIVCLAYPPCLLPDLGIPRSLAD
jgi:hypothetical protein